MLLIQNILYIWVLYFIFCCNACFTEDGCGSSGLKLAIDHDGGADDALAISISLLNEKYFNGPKVIALTASYGNVNISQAIFNSARILKLCNRSDIPIYVGAQKPLIKGISSDHFFGYDGLGDDGTVATGPVAVEKVHAAVALIELSKKYKGNLVVMTIGPATNVALAISLDPDFIGRLSHFYIGAGHIYSEAYSEAEFNAALDPEAYSIVARSASADKVTILPYSQVYDTLNISKTWRKKVLGAINTPIIKGLNGYERLPLARPQVKSWALLDPAVAVILLDPSIVTEYKTSCNGIILYGAQRGIITNNFKSKEPNARLVISACVEKYKKRLIEIFSAELLQNTGSKFIA